MQKALNVGGGTPLSHTLPPRSLRSLADYFYRPLKLNPGYATVYSAVFTGAFSYSAVFYVKGEASTNILCRLGEWKMILGI